MLDNSIRENCLQALRCALSNIQSGLLIEACTTLPDPQFILMDGFDTTGDISGWNASGSATSPTLYVGPPLPPKPPGAMNMGKLAEGGASAFYIKTYDVSLDASDKLGFAFFYVENNSLLHNTQALRWRMGTDNTNYYELTFSRSDFADQEWRELVFDFDAAAVTGSPDRTSIQRVTFTWRAITAIQVIPNGDLKVDWLALFDKDGWLPGGGAHVPELSTDNPVVGLYSIAFGKIADADDVFGVSKILSPSIDGTGGILEAWIYVKDKTKLTSIPPNDYSIGLLVGNSSTAFWAKFLFEDDLFDVDHDKTNGWNQIEFNPVTEYDLKIGDPDISTISYLAIGGIAISEAIEIPVGEIKTDYWRFSGIDGEYNLDVKDVYRFKISAYQTHGSPTIMMAALKEDIVSKTFPIVTSTLMIGLDGEVELSGEALLDKELGKLASDIQKALAVRQNLDGFANYVEVKSLEYSVKKGTSYGILTVMIEIEYNSNQLDPTKKGL